MVKGLGTFRRHFDGQADQFILIGGTAETLAMEGADGLFSSTQLDQLLATLAGITKTAQAAA